MSAMSRAAWRRAMWVPAAALVLFLLYPPLSGLAGLQYALGNVPFDMASCTEGKVPSYDSATKSFKCSTPGGGSIPSGALTFILSGTCPAGFTEDASLTGKTLFGTVAANGDVGGTGGADSIIPAGTNTAPALTMNAYTPAGLVAAPVVSWPAGAPTFTGTPSSAIVNHVHVQSVGTSANGSLAGYTYDASTSSSTAAGYSTANPTGGVASYTPAGTNTWPAGVPTNTAPAFTGTQATLTGSVAAPVFTGAQFDNRSAFVKVIFCRAN